MLHLPEHLSFSALSRYEECPRSWYLGYVKRAEPKQTWFFPMGTAVHTSIESYIETGNVPKFEDIFYPLVAKQMKLDPVDVNWLAAGSQDDPTIRAKAVDLGKKCVENAVKFLEDVEVHDVERELLVNFPGCELPVKMFIDLTCTHKKYGPLIVDWKSGKTKPKSPLQLKIYGAGLLIEDGFPMEYDGWWGMLHPDTTAKTHRSKLVKLGDVEPAEIGRRFQAAYEGMKAKIYKANSGFACRFCTQSPNCLIEAGPTSRAKYYDKSEQEGIPY